MEKVKCIIVEDEKPASDKLTSYIQKIDYLNLIASFDQVASAFNWLNQNNVDLIFLDLHLGELNGFELLKNIPRPPSVIITTAYSEYAIESYQYYINAYLLKPYSFADFLRVLDKLPKTKTPPAIDKKFIFIKSEHRLEKVMVHDILYLEGMKDYIKVITKERQLMTLMNFKEILDLLDSPNFFRVHHSFVVAIDKIDFVERNRIVIKEKYIPISDSKRENFLNLIKNVR